MESGPEYLQTPAGRRRGIALPVVGALLLVISIGALMLQHASRQRFREAHRHTSQAVAAALAESGLNVTLENVWTGVRTPDSTFHSLLVEGVADELEGVEITLDNPYLDEAVAPLDDASLEVTVGLRNFRSFYPEDGLKGIARDHREKFGELVVTSTGTYRGVIQRYIAVKRVKVVNATAPTLGKFTLFVRRQDETPVNCLEYDRLRPNGPLSLEGSEARPLILFNRRGKLPTLEGDAFHPMADLFADIPPDEGGLVFLGGPDPWHLNLVHGSGAGPFEELFHLRRARMMSPSEIAGGNFDYRIWFGFYRGVMDGPPFQAGVGSARRPRRVGGQEVTDRTSAIHLYGDVLNVSPTLVLGPVFRSYVLVPLIDGIWLPYLDSGEYSGLPGSPVITPYETYARNMVRVVEESYNRSYDFILTNSEALQEDGTVDAAPDMPFVPTQHLTPDRFTRVAPAQSGDDYFLYPRPADKAAGLVHLKRPMEGGEAETVFRGALDDIDGELLARALEAKAVERVADQAEFEARYGMGPLDLPGIVLVESGGLELKNRTVEETAMILVKGDVTVSGFLSQNQEGKPLTLVSLDGNVHVRTGEIVQAALVALQGTAFFPRGQVNLIGSLAARVLDTPSLVGGTQAKWLTWNPDLDPTDETVYRKHLRFFMADELGLRIQGH